MGPYAALRHARREALMRTAPLAPTYKPIEKKRGILEWNSTAVRL